jgi:hypothetical protein
MALDVSEWTLVPLIDTYLQNAQTNAATLVPELFPQASSALQAQIITSLGATGSLASVRVQLAYLPNAQPAFPSVYLYEVPGGEDISGDVIGNVVQEEPVTDANGTITGWTTWIGILSRKSWQITVGTVNITDLLVLVGLVKAALIAARPSFGASPNAYQAQNLSWSGWGPMANSAGGVIFPFQQTLTFTITTYESTETTNTTLVTGTTPATILTASE